MCIYIYVYVYVYVYAYIYTYTYIYIYICACLCACAYIYICTYPNHKRNILTLCGRLGYSAPVLCLKHQTSRFRGLGFRVPGLRCYASSRLRTNAWPVAQCFRGFGVLGFWV